MDRKDNHVVTSTSASENSVVLKRLAPQFMDYQLVGGTISIMIWHADRAQQTDDGGAFFPDIVHKINNCNSFANTEELLTHLKNANRACIAERIILSVGFQEGRMRKFVFKDFMKTFETTIHVLRDKGCREMLVTNVPPCAVESRRIQHWMSLQSLNAGIKKFCYKNEGLHFCNIFQLFCYPRNFKRRKEYVINNDRNYDLNLELYDVTPVHHRLSYKDLAVIFSDEGKKVLWQHIKKTIECRANQLTMPPIKTRSLISKLEKYPVLKNGDRFSKNLGVRQEKISLLHSSNIKVSKPPSRAHKKRNAVDGTNSKRSYEPSKENTISLKKLLNYDALELISSDENIPSEDGTTSVVDQTNNGPENTISSTEEFCESYSSEEKPSRNRSKSEYTVIADDDQVPKNHGEKISLHFDPMKTSSNVTDVLRDFMKYKRNTLAYEMSKLSGKKNCKEVPSLTTIRPRKNANNQVNEISSTTFINLDSSEGENEEQGVNSWRRSGEKKFKQGNRPMLQLVNSFRKRQEIRHDPNEVFCDCDPCQRWHRETLQKLSELVKELKEDYQRELKRKFVS